MIISEELYDSGYRIDGEGRRVNIINPENKICRELFFFNKEVLMMSSDDFQWANGVERIFMDQGEPRIEWF